MTIATPTNEKERSFAAAAAAEFTLTSQVKYIEQCTQVRGEVKLFLDLKQALLPSTAPTLIEPVESVLSLPLALSKRERERKAALKTMYVHRYKVKGRRKNIGKEERK